VSVASGRADKSSVGRVLSLGGVQHDVCVVRRGDRRAQRRVRSHACRPLRPRLDVRRLSHQRARPARPALLRASGVPRPAAQRRPRRRRPVPRRLRQVLPTRRRRLPERSETLGYFCVRVVDPSNSLIIVT